MSCASLQNSYLNTSGSAPAVAFQTMVDVGAGEIFYNGRVPGEGGFLDDVVLPASNVPATLLTNSFGDVGVKFLTLTGMWAPGAGTDCEITISESIDDAPATVIATTGTLLPYTYTVGSNVNVLSNTPVPFSITAIRPIDTTATSVTWTVSATGTTTGANAGELGSMTANISYPDNSVGP